MNITDKNEILEIDFGFFMPTFEIKKSDIIGWELVAEENGATYFSFKYEGSAQNVSIPSENAEELKLKMEAIERILNMRPVLSVSEQRLSGTGLILAADTTLSTIILSVILATMGGT